MGDFSLLNELFQNGKLLSGALTTVWMTALSTLIAYVIGLPLGVILYVTSPQGLKPQKWVNALLGFIVNALRSIPFIILMVAMIPVAKFFVGTSIGDKAMTVMLVVAAAPYISRMVESSLKEIDGGVIEAARSMGASDVQIIFKVLLPETKPSLIVGAVISTVTVIGYQAMSATIAGNGLGAIAITYGYQRYHQEITWVCVLLIIIIVQLVQNLGTFIANKTDRRLKNRKKGVKQ